MSNNEAEDGNDICGHTINTETNCIGNVTFVSQGDLSYCGECGALVRDERRPIYRKCKAKNKLKNCKDFLSITKAQILQKKAKSVIISIKNMLQQFDFKHNYILLAWLVFNIAFFINKEIFLQLDYRTSIIYVLVTITLFGVAMKK